jgi:hypothetical protein
MSTYYLNDIELTDVISNNATISESRNLIGTDLVLLSAITISVFGEHYDPFSASSPFYGLDNALFKDMIFKIIDDDGTEIEGVINDITFDHKTNQVNIQVYPFLSKKMSNTFTYFEDGITPAKALREVLELNGLSSNIDYPSFYNAEYAQEDQNFYCNYTITTNDNVKIIDFANTIADLTGSDIYISSQNLISVIQYNRYLDPTPDFNISEDKIVNVSVNKQAGNVINKFQLQTIYGNYEDASGAGTESIEIFGENIKQLDFTNTQQISTNSLNAMIWAGENHVYRNRNPKWNIQLECVNQLDKPVDLKNFFSVTDINTDVVFETIGIVKEPANNIIRITGASV